MHGTLCCQRRWDLPGTPPLQVHCQVSGTGGVAILDPTGAVAAGGPGERAGVKFFYKMFRHHFSIQL